MMINDIKGKISLSFIMIYLIIHLKKYPVMLAINLKNHLHQSTGSQDHFF